MSERDIVERLRYRLTTTPPVIGWSDREIDIDVDLREAADEIERLRTQLARYSGQMVTVTFNQPVRVEAGETVTLDELRRRGGGIASVDA